MSQVILVLGICENLLREGLRLLLGGQNGIKLVATCSSLSRTIEEARKFHPDVVLIDTGFLKDDSLSIIQRVNEISPKSKVILWASARTGQRLQTAIRSGALGYISQVPLRLITW